MACTSLKNDKPLWIEAHRNIYRNSNWALSVILNFLNKNILCDISVNNILDKILGKGKLDVYTLVKWNTALNYI